MFRTTVTGPDGFNEPLMPFTSVLNCVGSVWRVMVPVTVGRKTRVAASGELLAGGIPWRGEPVPVSLVLVTLNWYSKAPMSVGPKRGKPRWSVAGAWVLTPPPMAGLLGS